ncbi:IclR family transcriptional regulator [Rhodophyticola sp. CCM32]|uniref:IclR family transcriptional regulator n=1 Tax=Rhodophyticola sp. CCM32 TaxID=2916397 RepID=UPI00107F84FD|nr:IclR family transcriptional regulator [Rhodophyticola sp. CCM32]QBY00816.1 IclR family transcriptional regulator [Rhodophyticola sp. CCM32]
MGKQDKPPGTYQAPAVDKAIDVLEFLAKQPEGATKKELTQALDRSISEIYRIILALENRRFLYKDSETDRYHLSLRMFELSHKFPPTARLIHAALPVLEELAGEALQSCHLGVAEADKLVIIASAESPMPMHYGVKTGASFPLLETGSGVVLSADIAPSRATRLLADFSEAEKQEYLTRFEAIRKAGYEVGPSSVVDGMTNIAFAVRDHNDRSVAAITVPYLAQSRANQSIEAVTEMARRAAESLSASLGSPPSEKLEQ